MKNNRNIGIAIVASLFVFVGTPAMALSPNASPKAWEMASERAKEAGAKEKGNKGKKSEKAKNGKAKNGKAKGHAKRDEAHAARDARAKDGPEMPEADERIVVAEPSVEPVAEPEVVADPAVSEAVSEPVTVAEAEATLPEEFEPVATPRTQPAPDIAIPDLPRTPDFLTKLAEFIPMNKLRTMLPF